MAVQSAPQTSIGAYRIFGQLGSGGMGVIYAAEHESLARKAAIKVLPPELTGDEEVVSRFLDEAKTAGAIGHPGIVAIHDVGYRGDGIAYAAMEFLQGESLADRLARAGRLPVKQALRFAGQTADALLAAHTKGLVHCVLQPGNLFIVKDSGVPGGERIKILDFGIAKLSGAGGKGAVQSRTGVLSAPEYLSPEQCSGAAGQIDHRADLYALGCILFHMLCGRPPFDGGGRGAAAIVASHLNDPPPPPRSLRNSAPRDIDAVINFLLAKDPERRYPSASDLRNSLAAILREPVLFRQAAGKLGAADKSPSTPPAPAKAEQPSRLPLSAPPPTEPRMPATPPSRKKPPAQIVPDPVNESVETLEHSPDAGDDPPLRGTDSRARTLKRPIRPRRITVVKVDAQPERQGRGRLIAGLAAAVVVMGGIAFAVVEFGDRLLPGNSALVKASPGNGEPGDGEEFVIRVATDSTAAQPEPPPPDPALRFIAADEGSGEAPDKGQDPEEEDSGATDGNGTGDRIIVWRIDSKPDGAQVLHRGELVGATPLRVEVAETPDFSTELTLRLEEYDDKVLELSATEPFDEQVELARQIPVEVRSKPSGAEVVGPDGASLGITPATIYLSRRDEPVSLTLRHEGYEPYALAVVADRKRRERVVMAKKRAVVIAQIDSEPSGATVSKDGESVGVTPLVHEFLEVKGTVKYVVELEGYRKKTIRLRGDRNDSERVVLKKARSRAKCRKSASGGESDGPAFVDPYDPC